MTRIAPLLALTLVLSLTGCQDTRRQAVRDYLETHVPEHFAIAEIPADFTVSKFTNDATLHVKYRLERPTVEIFDALSLPRGKAVLERIDAVREWAASSLPAGHAVRKQIEAASARARDPLPVKRVVTPAGTVIDTLVLLKVAKTPAGWKAQPELLEVQVPGKPDTSPDIPPENSPGANARFDQLDRLAANLDLARQKYLEERRLAAERSLAALRTRLQAGSTFEGELPGMGSARLVISRGSDGGAPVVAVLTVRRALQSAARFTGAISALPDGTAVWRATQVVSLSNPGMDPATSPEFHPILTLSPANEGLVARIKSDGQADRIVPLQPAGRVELLPEPDTQAP